jgi:hypothetical protein
MGPLRVDGVNSGINLASEHHFGGVMVRKDHLRVGFLADHQILSKRLFAIQRVGPHRVEYHVAVSSPADVDAELLGWLAEAQALQARRR